jgi:large subunit ribosomal protein L25
MEVELIKAESRAAGGRHANERLRRRGLIPAVVYGHGQPPENLAVDAHDLHLVLLRKRHVVKVNLGGQERAYLLKDVQYDYLQTTPIHVDLMRVDLSERVRVKVPVILKGEPLGVREGGVLIQILPDVELECPLMAIPESITHNVAELNIGQTVHVRDLAVPADTKATSHAEDIVATCQHKRGEVEEAAAAAPATEGEATTAEPEVISRGKLETEEETGK